MFGEYYDQRGQAEQARAWYEETLRLNPDHVEAAKALVRLGRSELLLR